MKTEEEVRKKVKDLEMIVSKSTSKILQHDLEIALNWLYWVLGNEGN